LGHLPNTPNECHAYIVTGSAASVLDDDQWIVRLSDFLTDVAKKVPIMGVCFGHHLLHQTFGGTVQRSTKGHMIRKQQFQSNHTSPFEQFASLAA